MSDSHVHAEFAFMMAVPRHQNIVPVLLHSVIFEGCRS